MPEILPRPSVGEILDLMEEYHAHASLWDRRVERGEDPGEAERIAKATYRRLVRLVHLAVHGRSVSW